MFVLRKSAAVVFKLTRAHLYFLFLKKNRACNKSAFWEQQALLAQAL